MGGVSARPSPFLIFTTSASLTSRLREIVINISIDRNRYLSIDIDNENLCIKIDFE